ncbi:MAG: DUF2782 domain-containing protein [Acidiferrobacterales bacterium]
MRRHWLLAVLLLLSCGGTYAADAGAGDVQTPSPAAKFPLPKPPAESTDQLPAPQVTITTHGTTRYKQFRVGGVVYMVEVIPAKGPPYYLIDRSGTGQFSRSNIAPRLSPPMWLIKRF